MKVLVITANIGGIDDVPDMPSQTIDNLKFVYTENNLPHSLSLLDNRTKARYLKMLPHRFFPEFDFYIWLDGRVQVTSEKFVETYLMMLHEKDFVCTLHGSRYNVYDELKFMLHEMNKGNHYLIDRYGKQGLRRELELLYYTDFPKSFPLFASGMFIRRNDERINRICEDWFLKCLEYTNFDQVMLSYIMHNNKLKFSTLPYENEFYKVLKHKPHDEY